MSEKNSTGPVESAAVETGPAGPAATDARTERPGWPYRRRPWVPLLGGIVIGVVLVGGTLGIVRAVAGSHRPPFATGQFGGGYGPGGFGGGPVGERGEELRERAIERAGEVWDSLPEELQQELIGVLEAEPGDRAELRSTILQDALAGEYGERAQVFAEFISAR